jgi:hypothetical protein
VCSLVTIRVPVEGSAKGSRGWVSVGQATVYLDHPTHAPFVEALNVDFTNDDPSARVAIELSVESARRLVTALETALCEGMAAGVA